jgi:glycosyltransferase involved in cell wall biosynthesis
LFQFIQEDEIKTTETLFPSSLLPSFPPSLLPSFLCKFPDSCYSTGMEPFVSVIIPVYNRRDFLKRAVASVESQLYRQYEIIIADDGSTDQTRKYAESTGHTCIPLEHTGKPGYVRNMGFLASRGDYIAFLDSDDVWKPEKLDAQVKFFVQHPDIVICHTREIWERNGTIVSQKKQKHKRQGDIFFDALKKCIIGPSTVMIKRDVFTHSGMFHPGLEIAEDYELWLRLTARYTVGYIDIPLVVKYGGHTDQLSEKYGHIEYFRIKALEHVLEMDIFTPSRYAAALREMVRKCQIYALGCEKRGKTREAGEFRALLEKYKKKLEKYPDMNHY